MIPGYLTYNCAEYDSGNTKGMNAGTYEKALEMAVEMIRSEAVKRFIHESDKVSVRREIENLVAGEVIQKEIHQELTYKGMNQFSACDSKYGNTKYFYHTDYGFF